VFDGVHRSRELREERAKKWNEKSVELDILIESLHENGRERKNDSGAFRSHTHILTPHPHNHQHTRRCWRARHDGSERRPNRFRQGISRSDLLMYVHCVCVCLCVGVYVCMCVPAFIILSSSVSLFLSIIPPRSLPIPLSFSFSSRTSSRTRTRPPSTLSFLPLTLFPSLDPSLPPSPPHFAARGRFPRSFLCWGKHHPLHQKRVLR